jgi:hypothetical protein
MIAGMLLALIPAVVMPIAVPQGAALALTCEASLDAEVADAVTLLQDLLARASTIDDPASACDTWTLRLSGTFTLTSALEYRGGPMLHLTGTDPEAPAVLAADGHRVLGVFTPADHVELTDLVLRGGRARGAPLDGAGGAVGFEPQDAVLSTLRATRVAFRDNDAARGGAIAADRVVLLDVELDGNTADEGGALDVFEVMATRTTFVDNAATGAPGTGGAVRASGDVVLVNSTFSANRARIGGSVWIAGLAAPTLRATFTTFASVHAEAGGAHLHADIDGGGAVALVLRGSVLTGVGALDPGGAVRDACAGFSTVLGPDGSIAALAPDASCGEGVTVLTEPPVLDPLPPAGTAAGTGVAARVHAPAADGALTDLVDCDDSWPPTDQRGIGRPQPTGGRCDVGAVELVGAPAGPDVRAPDGNPILGGSRAAPQPVPTTVRAGGGPAPRRPLLTVWRWPRTR